jgi:mRNA-degrading endonuclease toxin of MazEF toxin-antitoxin module
MDLQRGDVVRSVDPFKLGTDRQRPWLLLSNDRHPFDGEQYVAVAISTKSYEHSLSMPADVWEVGGVPEQSSVSPWAVHSPRDEDIHAWQGRVAQTFVDQVKNRLTEYLH